jgi:putative heme iron utilization protein
MSLAKEALQFLRTTHNGVLSTLSNQFEGYPFGSVAPFVLDHSGQPIVLISTIAEHTKNIIANPKVSLLVLAGMDDLQANARLTLLGEATIIDKSGAHLRARYLRYFPQAAGYFDMHDFHFYRISITQVRYIAGFGKMGWLTANDFSKAGSHLEATTESTLAEQESAIIEHMNADHSASLIAYCQHFHGLSVDKAQMLGIDSDGFDVQAIKDATEKRLRFNFDHPIHDALTARTALVAMSKAAASRPS